LLRKKKKKSPLGAAHSVARLFLISRTRNVLRPYANTASGVLNFTRPAAAITLPYRLASCWFVNGVSLLKLFTSHTLGLSTASYFIVTSWKFIKMPAICCLQIGHILCNNLTTVLI
jgi:hypothetical protein